jgi:2,3,4,5-tetrahydropyridine-2-carboxylate N-succinyltransferase
MLKGQYLETMQQLIEQYFSQKEQFSVNNAPYELKEHLEMILNELNTGRLRVCEKQQGKWVTHAWVKQAILLCFRIYPNQVIGGGFSPFYDKIPLKYQSFGEQEFLQQQARIVPHAIVRDGAFIGKNCILMPSYVNIGAYVDEGSMIDTWATVGSCAQIGKNVHISGGAGIGGVLEPLQSNPTIIEDHCFIGARSEVVEGVIVEEGSVLGMGVFIGQSTKIYDRQTGEITYGRVPAGSVVVAGSLPSQTGDCQLYCAVIVKQVDAKTRAKTSTNQLLRDD